MCNKHSFSFQHSWKRIASKGRICSACGLCEYYQTYLFRDNEWVHVTFDELMVKLKIDDKNEKEEAESKRKALEYLGGLTA